MASTSSRVTVPERDASSQVLSSLLEKLDEEVQAQLDPFIPEVEEHIRKSIESIPEKELRRRSKEGVLGAAIYDTFMSFEESTGVKIPLPILSEAIGIPMCSIHANWQILFDTRVKLDTSRIERVSYTTTDPEESVSEVISQLRRAIVETSEGLDDWFADVESSSKELIKMVDRKALSEYPPDIVASTAVYTVVNKQGKPLVPLSRREAALTCNVSQSLIAKVGLNLFNGEIS